METNVSVFANLVKNQSDSGSDSGQEPPVTVAILNQVRTLVQCVLAPVVVLLGICANSLNIVILSQKWMRSSTSVYLLALAAYDILYLLASLFNNIKNCVPTLLQAKAGHYGVPLSNLFSNTAVLIICTFSCERYIAVSHPIRGRVWCTVRRATLITAAVCVLATLLTMPDFLPQEIQKLLDSAIGYSWLNTIVFTYIPIVFLVFCNALLIKAVYQASSLRTRLQQPQAPRTNLRCAVDERRSSRALCEMAAFNAESRARKANSEQNKLTVMLIVVVIVFIVCQLPQAVLYLLKRYYDAHQIKLSENANNIRRIIGNFSNMLVQINAASNFVLYSLFSTRFRATFRRTVCKCMPRKKESNTTVGEYNGTIVNRSSPTNCTQVRHGAASGDTLQMRSSLLRKESTKSRRSTLGTISEGNT